jgi:hypothetical protein
LTLTAQITVSSISLRSNTTSEVRAANGVSRTSSHACSVADSAASMPPMIRTVVEAKNDGPVPRFCTTTPSTTRFSYTAACNIQRRRLRFVSASSDGRTSA